MSQKGTGTTILTGTNTYSGATTVSAGRLFLKSTGALGGGQATGTAGVTLSAGSLNFYTGNGGTPYNVAVGTTGAGALNITAGASIGGELGGTLKAGTASTPGSGTVLIDVYGSPGIASPGGNIYTNVSAASGLGSAYTMTVGKVYNNINLSLIHI